MSLTTRDVLHDADLFRQAHPNWPRAEPEAAAAESRTLRITVVRTADLPDDAVVLGHADSWDAAAKAREFYEQTGCQASLPGYVPEGRC